MTEYYVSTSGHNSANGTSISSPFRTINYAIDSCGSGDTVYVRQGTYTEGISISNSGTLNNYNALTNYGNEHVILKRSTINNHGISLSANYWKISGFEITHTWHPIIVSKDRHHFIFSNLNCHYNGYSLLLGDGVNHVLIENSEFYEPYSSSSNYIGLRGEENQISHHIIIRNCEFRDSQHVPINAWTGVQGCKWGLQDILVEGCHFEKNRQSCLYTNEMGITRLTVRNCTFNHNGRGIQACMRDSLIEDCVVTDHGSHFVFGQVDGPSRDVVVRDIIAHSGNWGNSDYCICFNNATNIQIYNVIATGNFYATSKPAQIPDPRPTQTLTPIPTYTPPPPTPIPTQTPPPTNGSIYCTCNIVASVTFNHSDQQITPHTYTNVPSGYQYISFKKTGYIPHEHWVWVIKGQTSNAHGILVLDTSTKFPINFISSPSGAIITEV